MHSYVHTRPCALLIFKTKEYEQKQARFTLTYTQITDIGLKLMHLQLDHFCL